MQKRQSKNWAVILVVACLLVWAMTSTILLVLEDKTDITSSSAVSATSDIGAADEGNTVSQVDIEGTLSLTPPGKTSYKLGETLDFTGFSAVMTKPDKTTVDVTTSVEVVGDTGIVGEQEIIIRYGDQVASYKITVSRTDAPEYTDLDNSTKNIMVIGTGGTMAGLAGSSTAFQTYSPGMKSIASMIDALPNTDTLGNIESYQFGNSGSSGYTIGDLYDLSRLADRYLDSFDGVVITCGTDTLEEIAYFMDITIQSTKPVVVTGSMRPWNVIGSDAPANLYNAIKLAASGKTTNFGTVVMLNDEIHAARDITKTNSDRLDTFQSPMFGMLGYIDEGRISIYRQPLRASKEGSSWYTPFDLTKIDKSDLPRVEIVLSYQNAGAEAITAYAESGVKGIVTAGTGAGGISQAMLTARSAAMKKGVVFMMTTRTGSGTLYSSSGSLIAGDNLSPYKARIFLQVSLAFSKNTATLRQWASDYAAVRE